MKRLATILFFAALAGSVAAFGEPRQAVVGDRFPRRGVRHELPHRRTNAGIVVERPHPDGDRFGMTGVRAEDRRPAVAAEPLLAVAVGWFPHPQLLLTGDDPEAARGRVRLRRSRGTTPPLTSLAVAVARAQEWLRDFEANRAAIAAAAQREVHRGRGLGSRRWASLAYGFARERLLTRKKEHARLGEVRSLDEHRR